MVKATLQSPELVSELLEALKRDKKDISEGKVPPAISCALKLKIKKTRAKSKKLSLKK